MLFCIWVVYVEPVLFRIQKEIQQSSFRCRVEEDRWLLTSICFLLHLFFLLVLLGKRLKTCLTLGRGWEGEVGRIGHRDNHAFSLKGKNLRFRPRWAFSSCRWVWNRGGPCCHAGFLAFLLRRNSNMEQALVYVWKIHLHLKNNCVHG